MKYLEDGVDHINVYSKGATILGRFLSNFARWPMQTEDGPFQSVEGYWYWLGCKDVDRDLLRYVSGFEAKELGRELGCADWLDSEEFKSKIKQAITLKINSHSDMRAQLESCRLPLTHYYVYGSKRVNVPKAKWLLEHLESFKKEL